MRKEFVFTLLLFIFQGSDSGLSDVDSVAPRFFIGPAHRRHGQLFNRLENEERKEEELERNRLALEQETALAKSELERNALLKQQVQQERAARELEHEQHLEKERMMQEQIERDAAVMARMNKTMHVLIDS